MGVSELTTRDETSVARKMDRPPEIFKVGGEANHTQQMSKNRHVKIANVVRSRQTDSERSTFSVDLEVPINSKNN